MRRKRLTDDEVKEFVRRIRDKYSVYQERFSKSGRRFLDFEDRYIEAIRARLDIASFLQAETEVVDQLIANEEERKRIESKKVEAEKARRVAQENVATRYFQEQKRRIAKYARLPVHPDASEELERLFGALGAIDREFWSDIEKLLRKAYTSIYTSPRSRIEEKILQLCRPGAGDIPPRLSRYRALFEWFPRNYLEIEKEEKKTLLESAFFLFDLEDVLGEMQKAEVLLDADRDLAGRMREFVINLISDFRLKEFKSLQR